MDKAQKALRRSSIRLKSFSSGHGELNMIISDIDHMRSTAKAFLRAQQTMVEDLMDWASKERSIAVQETLGLLAELSLLWSETQKEFIDQLKTFKHQFDMILEGERSVDKIRAQLTAYEQKEAKLKRDLKKNSVVDETKRVESKLDEVKSSITRAQVEVSEQVNENEVVKLIRLKDGLLKLSDYYLELAFKCNVIFDAHRTVISDIPSGQDKNTNIQNMVYSGSKFAKTRVLQAKESVKNYKQSVAARSTAPYEISSSDLPPPYSPNISQTSSFASPASNSFASPASSSFASPVPVPPSNQNLYSSHRYDQISEIASGSNRYDDVSSDGMRYENLPDLNSTNGRYHNTEPFNYGFRVGTSPSNYEQDVAGAMSNAHLK